MKQLYHLYFIILSTSVWSTASSVLVELLPGDNVYICSPTSSAVQEIAFVCSLTGWTYTVDWTVTSGNGESNAFTILRRSLLNVSESYGFPGIQISLTAESHQYMSSSLIITAPPYQISNVGIIVSCHDLTARSVNIIDLPTAPQNLTACNYSTIENDTELFSVTLIWLPPTTVTSTCTTIIYVLNIEPLPNSGPYNTSSTTTLLILRYNVPYNVSVEAMNCVGSSKKTQMLLSYQKPALPTAPQNLTACNYSTIENDTEFFSVTLIWLPPTTVTSTCITINYVLNIQPLPNSTFYGLYNTSSTTTLLILRYNVPYNVSVEGTNCVGSSNKTQILLSYKKPVRNINETLFSSCGIPETAAFILLLNSTNTEFDSMIKYRCNDGYLPASVKASFCNNFGKWEPDPLEHICIMKDDVEIGTNKSQYELHMNGIHAILILVFITIPYCITLFLTCYSYIIYLRHMQTILKCE